MLWLLVKLLVLELDLNLESVDLRWVISLFSLWNENCVWLLCRLSLEAYQLGSIVGGKLLSLVASSAARQQLEEEALQEIWFFFLVRLVSNGSFHWVRRDSDMCPRVDTTRVRIRTWPVETSIGYKPFPIILLCKCNRVWFNVIGSIILFAKV